MDVHVLLEPAVDLPGITKVLDELGHEGRLHTVHTWTKGDVAALFEAAKGYQPLDLSFLVPDGVPVLTEVIHDGENSLPLFRHFQKRFAKLATPGELVGYNQQAFGMFTGPGYFVVRAAEPSSSDAGELLIDYTKTPSQKPEGWPPIAGHAGIGRLAYGGMIDHLRGLSTHVSIGRAYRGKPMDTWFVLVRRDS